MHKHPLIYRARGTKYEWEKPLIYLSWNFYPQSSGDITFRCRRG